MSIISYYFFQTGTNESTCAKCRAWQTYKQYFVGLAEDVGDRIRAILAEKVSMISRLSIFLVCSKYPASETWIMWILLIFCRYVELNSTFGNKLYRRIKTSFPHYLCNRPPAFIKHCVHSLLKASREFDATMVHDTATAKVYKVHTCT